MSANNVVWVMFYEGHHHVFYSGCVDNTPIVPDYKDKYYKVFEVRPDALTYAHDVVNEIDAEYWQEGYVGVEYGVCELPRIEKGEHIEIKLGRIDKIINEWKQKIKDLEFSIEQFEGWKKELLK